MASSLIFCAFVSTSICFFKIEKVPKKNEADSHLIGKNYVILRCCVHIYCLCISHGSVAKVEVIVALRLLKCLNSPIWFSWYAHPNRFFTKSRRLPKLSLWNISHTYNIRRCWFWIFLELTTVSLNQRKIEIQALTKLMNNYDHKKVAKSTFGSW